MFSSNQIGHCGSEPLSFDGFDISETTPRADMPSDGRVRVTATAALLLALASIGSFGDNASASEMAISLPPWAVELNAAAHNSLATQLPEWRSEDQEDDLLTWAQRRRDHGSAPPRPLHPRSEADVFLVVGAKTSVLHGFDRRQAIRQTWASAAAVPQGVQVVFLGCEPDLSVYSEDHKQRLQQAIALERHVFGDLLTSELLDCHDSYKGLSDKVRAFFHWLTTRTYSKLAFAMVMDDDAYTRLDLLVAFLRRPSTPSRRFYAGNSACDWCRGLGPAHRDPRDKYYISHDEYPMAWLPPYLSGEHFVLSRDLVLFLGRNLRDLRGFGTMDDVAIGLWLFSLLRVQPTYLTEFQGMRAFESCRDHDLISLAELSVFATRIIHDNLTRGKSMCGGFELATWLKQKRTIASSTSDQSATTLTWELQYNTTQNQLRVAVQVVVGSVSVDFVYVPSATSAEHGLCGRAVALLQRKHYLTAGDDLCARFGHSILPALDESARDNPALAPFVAVALHNMRRLQLDDAIGEIERPVFTAVLSARASVFRVLIECLLVELHPDKRVLVWEEIERPNRHRRVDVVVLTRWDRASILRGALAHAGAMFLLDEPLSSPPIDTAVAHPHVVVFASKELDATDSATTKTLYVPLVTRAFARTMQYTPMMLLHARDHDRASGIERRGLRVLSGCEQTDASTLAGLLDLLRGGIDVDHVAACASDPKWFDEQTRSGFYIDNGIEMLRGTKFVVVTQTVEDDGSDRLAMAFLAGTIPIYLGHSRRSDTRPPLFHPESFIDCRSSANVDDCAHHVKRVHASSALYEQMRLEPPIKDSRAFEETFSWYPGVVADMQTRGQSPTGSTRMSERLHLLLV